MDKSIKKFKVFVSRPVPGIGISILKKAGFSVEVNKKGKTLSKKELIKKLKGKDALLSLLTDQIDREVINSSKSLKIISNYAIGFDNIDLKAAKNKGIVVTNTPGPLITEAVSDHTIALLLAVARRIVEADEFTRQGKYKEWDPLLFMGLGMKGKTLGIVGLGRIGRMVSERAIRGLKMKVIYNTRTRKPEFEKKHGAKYVSLNELLKNADVISLHVPLTPKTKHMIGAKELRMMKKTAILLNTCRGQVVKEKPLVNALKKHRIWGAALDVFDCGPKITCDPKAAIQLKHLDNVILTPHIASSTLESREDMAKLAANGIVDLAMGKTPKNIVNNKKSKKNRLFNSKRI